MAEVTAVLSDIEVYEGTTKASGKPYTKFTVKAGGRDYVTFKRELVEPAATLKGQPVVIVYSESQNGQYTNYALEGIKVAPIGGTLAPFVEVDPNAQRQYVPGATGAILSPSQPILEAQRVSSSSNGSGAYNSPDKDTSIARAVALKAAVETATGLQLADADSDAILRIANTYVSWLQTGESNPFADLQENEPVALTDKNTGGLLAGAGL